MIPTKYFLYFRLKLFNSNCINFPPSSIYFQTILSKLNSPPTKANPRILLTIVQKLSLAEKPPIPGQTFLPRFLPTAREIPQTSKDIHVVPRAHYIISARALRMQLEIKAVAARNTGPRSFGPRLTTALLLRPPAPPPAPSPLAYSSLYPTFTALVILRRGGAKPR